MRPACCAFPPDETLGFLHWRINPQPFAFAAPVNCPVRQTFKATLDSTNSSASKAQRLGVVAAVSANLFWGLCPIYWRQLQDADSTELVCHRIVGSFLLLLVVIPILLRSGWWGGFKVVIRQVRDRRILTGCLFAALMIGTNWLGFIWAVNNERVLEASLGYYINPLFNVLLGVIVLRERLESVQWVAVGIVAAGVAVIAIGSGGIPWVSFVMASSFAAYSLIKKKVKLPILIGLFLEVAILVIPAAIYLGWRCLEGVSALQNGPIESRVLVTAAGLITVAPLALFAAGVQRIKLALVGLLQFVGPTIQFFLGAFLYGEPLESTRLLGFAFVWIGLAVFMFLPKLARRRIQ